jgi:hypothetical protein
VRAGGCGAVLGAAGVQPVVVNLTGDVELALGIERVETQPLDGAAHVKPVERHLVVGKLISTELPRSAEALMSSRDRLSLVETKPIVGLTDARR